MFGFFVSYSSAEALTISPPRVELRGNPGEVVKQEVVLTNDTKNTQIFYTSFANFEAQGETGAPAFVESRDDLDTWIQTESTVALKAGESRIVPISITIPNNAEPGGHFAAIFWGTTPPSTQGATLSIGAKVGMLILLSVNGEVREAGGLVSFSTVGKKFWYKTLPVSFEYRFRNDGGDRVKPTGTIRIRNTVFLPTKKLNANESNGNVLPGSTRKFTTDWLRYKTPENENEGRSAFKRFFANVNYEWKNFAVGLYSARLNVTYGSTGEHAKDTVFFFVFPWELLIVLIVLITFIWWGGKKLIRKYNNYIIRKSQSMAK